MILEREDVPPAFDPGAPMPAASPDADSTGMAIANGAGADSGEPRAFARPLSISQHQSLSSEPRAFATGPQRLHSALQPPPMRSNGALRPATGTSYRVPWTRHTSNSVGSNSSNSSTSSSGGGGSYSAGSRVSGNSSPRYSDLIDAINEATIASSSSTRRSAGMNGTKVDTRKRTPHGRQPGHAADMSHAQLSRNGFTEYDSPGRSDPGPRQHERASSESSIPLPYPLAPKGQSASQNGGSAENGGNKPANATKKRVRYLRDTDRRNIIRRIENGEKQAALAREFGVTRAAICHIKKNRCEIISRYDSLVKTAKEMDKQESFGIPPGGDVIVREVRSKSVLLLLTTLRDRRTLPSMFRRTAGRLIMILLEEAFASLESEPVRVTTTAGRPYDGLQIKHQLCGIGIGSEGLPFLVLLNQMEPDAPRGSIKIESTGDFPDDQHNARIEAVDLPPNVAEVKVFLFIATCSTGVAVCKAIEVLLDVGVEEHDISIVMLWCAADGLAFICNRFPRVRIITAAIDGATDNRQPEGLGDFVSRYNDHMDLELPDRDMVF